MLNILDGFAWKIGCRVGKNEDLLLLLTQATCPHCGEKMWIPDSLVLSIEKPTNLEKKPIIISLNSIHRYSDTTYEQIRRTLQQAYPQYCTLSERAEHCFHADCPSCQKTAVDFNQHDYEYFQYEKGPTWFEWLDLASLPEKMKLVSIPDVILTQEDADLTNEALTGAGKIYWTEKNNVSQSFYGTLNGRISLQTKALQIDVWGRNLTNKDYTTFYFETMHRGFEQKSRPLQLGVDIRYHF